MMIGSEIATINCTGIHRAAPADLLTQAIDYIRQQLNRSLPVNDRIRLFWAGVYAARDLAAADVVEEEFLQLGRDCRLTADLDRHGHEDIRHVLKWGMLGRNPFGRR